MIGMIFVILACEFFFSFGKRLKSFAELVGLVNVSSGID